jgi:carbon-monoxide dehydrogenase medium subunit
MDSGARVPVAGAGPSVFRAPDMEQALSKRLARESVANAQIAAARLNTDLPASAGHRAHLVTVLAKRAVAAALQ